MTSKLATPIRTGARPTAPLELLGTSPGVSVVDPGTVLTRLWYFDGKFLRASGFRLDQDYVRSLVGLSNQAAGTGVVSGLGVSRGTGDRLRVTGGLALAPSGRVVHLPQQIELSIPELIDRSSGRFDPGAKPDAGVADFSRCPPDQPAGPDQTLAGSPLYVLTASAVEALCGEEERFGRLCEDACATETDRSTVVEGVCFRVRELTLALPTSSAVAFGDRHLRSRVASAYFEQERRAVPSLISGAGLRSPIWCAAAEGIGGEEVPLAVLDRSGPVTRFVDAWIARRELMETTPSRYWAARMARRPEDVFLAQVLQFQCQLLDLGRRRRRRGSRPVRRRAGRAGDGVPGARESHRRVGRPGGQARRRRRRPAAGCLQPGRGAALPDHGGDRSRGAARHRLAARRRRHRRGAARRLPADQPVRRRAGAGARTARARGRPALLRGAARLRARGVPRGAAHGAHLAHPRPRRSRRPRGSRRPRAGWPGRRRRPHGHRCVRRDGPLPAALADEPGRRGRAGVRGQPVGRRPRHDDGDRLVVECRRLRRGAVPAERERPGARDAAGRRANVAGRGGRRQRPDHPGERPAGRGAHLAPTRSTTGAGRRMPSSSGCAARPPSPRRARRGGTPPRRTDASAPTRTARSWSGSTARPPPA